jgi:hypothetical protein
VAPAGTRGIFQRMADDRLRQVEAVLGAVSKITSGDEGNELFDARCPKCNASDFAHLPDVYIDARGRLEDNPDQANVPREGGLTDAQIVEKFAPPQRKSAVVPTVAVGVVVGGAAFYLYRRLGENAGLFAGIAAGIATIIVLLTSLRRTSDDYYARRKQWRSRYMCRRCGQVVEA